MFCLRLSDFPVEVTCTSLWWVPQHAGLCLLCRCQEPWALLQLIKHDDVLPAQQLWSIFVVMAALQGNALCFSAVPQGTVQIVQRCGKFNKVAHPGCNLICCCIGEFRATKSPSSSQQGYSGLKSGPFTSVTLLTSVILIKSTLTDALNCAVPGDAVAGGLSLRVQQLDVRCETKTKDNV